MSFQLGGQNQIISQFGSRFIFLVVVFFSQYVIKMEYSTMNRQFLKAARGGLEAFWVKQTHCSKQIVQIVLSWGIRHVFCKEM